MAERTLQDYARDAKGTADADRGKKEFWQPTSGREAHLRILEWPGHVPCWVQTHVHYLETKEGKRVMTCGDEHCYTCARLAEIAQSQQKADLEFVRQAARKLKIMMYIIDWDNMSAGPQLFEPKNTQNCNTWSTLLSLFLSEDWGERVYKMSHGVLISLNITKETRKLRSGQTEMAIQKSLTPGTVPKPIPMRRNPDGTVHIQLTLPNGTKQVFKLPDLGEAVSAYDEEYHRQCWGDETAADPGDVTFDEGNGGEEFAGDFNEGAGDGFSTGEQPAGGEGMFGGDGGAGDSWGAVPTEQAAVSDGGGQFDMFDPTPAPAQAPPEPVKAPPAQPRPQAPAAQAPRTRPAPPSRPRPAAPAPSRPKAPPSRPMARGGRPAPASGKRK